MNELYRKRILQFVLLFLIFPILQFALIGNVSAVIIHENVDTNSPINNSQNFDPYYQNDFPISNYDVNNNKIDDDLEKELEIRKNKEYNLLNKENLTNFRIIISVKRISCQNLKAFLSSNNIEIVTILDNPLIIDSDLVVIQVSDENILIIYTIIENFSNIDNIKFDVSGSYTMQNALEQGQLFPNLNNNYGLKGDKDSAIAIIDTGIDDSHPMLYGYGDKDSSKKITFWKDFSADKYTTPYDPNDHGSMVSSIAAGLPYNTSNAQNNYGNRVIVTRSRYGTWSDSTLEIGKHYIEVVQAVNVTAKGLIEVNGTWKKGSITSKTTFHNLTIIDEDGNYVNQTELGGEYPINTTVQFNITNTNQFGVYKVGFIFNVSENGDNDFYLYSDVGYNISEPLLQGVAPDSKIVFLRTSLNLYESEVIAALNWILENGTEYNVTVVNMSFRIASSTVASIVNELIENGFIVVAAAGNEYFGANSAGSLTNTPGSVDKVISVGAVDNNNHIASYSSQGGLSPTGFTIKPDIVAPGGEFPRKSEKWAPVIAADGNDMDKIDNTNPAEYTVDRIINDTRPAIGTSFSSPYVAGTAQLIIEKLGGVNNWNYTENEVLKVKSYILMTATETAPNTRNYPYGVTDYNPTLDRGEKDVHEGYGRVNPYAIIDMLNNTMKSGDEISVSMTSTSENNMFGTMCFGRKIELKSNHYYHVNLTRNNDADIDIFIYKSQPNDYGEPIILTKSIHEGYWNESLQFSPTENGTYFLIIKGVSGKSMVNITFNEYEDNLKPYLAAVYIPQNGDFLNEIKEFLVYFDDKETRIDSIKIYSTQLDNETKSNRLGTNFVYSTSYNDEFNFDTTIINDGWYYLTFTAVDANGNAKNSTEILVCIDNTSPEINLLEPYDEDGFYYSTIRIKANCFDMLSGVSRVDFFIYFNAEKQKINSVNSDGVIEFYWPSNQSYDGTVQIFAEAYDNAGNMEYSNAIRIYIDNRNGNIRRLGIFIGITAISFMILRKTAELILVNIDFQIFHGIFQKIRKNAIGLLGPQWKDYYKNLRLSLTYLKKKRIR